MNCIYLASIFSEDWIIILLVVIVLFGAKKLPDLARSLGKSVNEFKKGMNETEQSTEAKASKEDKADDNKKKDGSGNPT